MTLAPPRFCTVVASLFLVAGGLQAQSTLLTGSVRNREGVAIPGAVVVALPSMRASTTSDASGSFRLTLRGDIGERPAIRVTSIGYSAYEDSVALVGSEVHLDVVLTESAIPLDEMVVTGTAGERARRSQPASIAVVSAASAAESATFSSLNDLLQGRSLGVSISTSSGSVAAAQRISARGAGSYHLSNAPLLYIDGVRADGRLYSFLGGQTTSPFLDLDPDDIERIEILRGPAAATLYGADASAGVIHVLTKRGRAGGNPLRQTLSVDLGRFDLGWTPPDNFARCGETDVLPSSPSALCRGQAAGTVVRDNPLVREGVIGDGYSRSISLSARGGGEAYGYYFALGGDDQAGTLPHDRFERLDGRVNFDLAPTAGWRFSAGLGVARTLTELPQNGDNTAGLFMATLGNPLTVGTPANGWPFTVRSAEAISAIDDYRTVTRFAPRIEVSQQPRSWISHRVTLGADFSNGHRLQFFPRNDRGWFGPFLDAGLVYEERGEHRVLTLDYLANLARTFGPAEAWRSELAAGVQVHESRTDGLSAFGFGLVTNSARAVSQAANRFVNSRSLLATRSAGVFAQLQQSHLDRRFLQLGLRVDKSSGFGPETEALFLPKLGVSWILSEEPFWGDGFSFLEELRFRAAYGTTGRTPLPGEAALERTYSPAPYVHDDGSVRQGLVPRNAGNPGLRAERGRELEVGVDAGALNGRLGVELTLFDKRTRDLLLQLPIPPSHGFGGNQPLVNVGEVANQGVEVAFNVELIRASDVGWDLALGTSAVKNELVSWGHAPPVQRMVEGRPLGAVYSHRIRRVDLAQGVAIVSDTAEYVGQPLPTLEGFLGSMVTLGGRLRIGARFDWKAGHVLHDFSADWRDRVERVSERWVRRDELPAEERLRRFGPWRTEDGRDLGEPRRGPAFAVIEPYVQKADFLRWRELSLSYDLPAPVVGRIGAEGATVIVTGRNLALWTGYEGADPEVVTYAGGFGNVLSNFGATDFMTLPLARQLTARVQVSF